MKILDRVESRRAEKILAFIKIASAVFLLLIVFLAVTIKNAKFSDFRTFALPIVLLLNFYNIFTKQKGQFIEWREHEFEYKTRGEDGIIENKDIKNVSIHLDTVVIESINNDTCTINFQDFTDYKTRLKLKENFTKLQPH